MSVYPLLNKLKIVHKLLHVNEGNRNVAMGVLLVLCLLYLCRFVCITGASSEARFGLVEITVGGKYNATSNKQFEYLVSNPSMKTGLILEIRPDDKKILSYMISNIL